MRDVYASSGTQLLQFLTAFFFWLQEQFVIRLVKRIVGGGVKTTSELFNVKSLKVAAI